MNGNTMVALEEYAKQAEAIIPCPICHGYDISAGDEEAARRAYAMATDALEAGEFPGDSCEDIMQAMKGVLADANSKCPSCPG